MTTSPLTPEQLLAHVEWMRRLALALVRDADEADDLAQEGMEAALAHPPATDRPVRPWLAGVLRNLAKLRARGRGRRARRETAAELGEVPASPEALVARVQTERRITTLVLALDEPFRSTLLLRYYEGRTAAEIARAAGVPAGTVRWRLKTGLDRLRAELDREDDRRWRLILAPLLPRPAEAPALLEGVALMSMKKLVAGLVVMGLLLMGLLSWRHTMTPTAVTAAPPRLPVRVRAAGGPHGLPMVASAEPDAPGVLRMQGQVIDASEAPIAGAVVAIDTHPPRTATTDANGVFVFPELRQRDYTLEAQGRGLYAGPVTTAVSTTGEPVVLRARPATTIEVTVLAGSAPVAGAHVELRSTLVWRADSDARGVARLDGVGPGFRPLRVEAAGFAPAVRMVVTDAGPGVQPLVVRLESGFAASGRVVDQNGRPVAGARVWPRSASEPFPTIDPAFDAVTSDGQGRWSIAALPPGSYQFLAGHPDFAQATSPPVPVAAAVTGIELRLEGGGQVTGIVRGADGKPVADAEVRAAALSGMAIWPDLREAFTDDAGRFRIGGLPRRTIQLMALHATGTSAMATVELGAAATADLQLTLSVKGSVAGIVVDGHGRPLPEAEVTARSTALWTHGPIKSGSLTSWDLRGIPTLIADAGGRFRFTGLPEGRYALTAVRPGAPPDHRNLQPAVEVSPGDAEVRVVVRGDGAVKGRVVLEGRPADSFSVSLGPVNPAPFGGGAFLLAAPAGTHALTITGPAFATKEVEDVTVREGETRDLGTITVERGRSISGRVVGPDGAPVAAAQVVAGQFLSGGGTQLYIPTESGGAQETTSDEDGRFTLTGFEPGPLVVVAERAGQGRSDTISIPPQQSSARLDLVLRPTGAVEGRVTRDGSPFADTVVIATRQLRTANFFVMTGPDGRFALDTLAPGPQLLQVFVNRHKDMLLRSITVEVGKRAHVDLDVRTGAAAIAVSARGPDGPLPAQAFVVSPPVSIAEGEPLGSVIARLAPTEPTISFQADAPHTFEGLAPGRYSVCAAAGKRGEARLYCTEREVSGRVEVALTIPTAPVATQ